MSREIIQSYNQLTSIDFEGKKLITRYLETTYPAEGVTCHVYEFVNDPYRDLGVVEIAKGVDRSYKTPEQRVEKVGENQRTTEIYVEGNGGFRVKRADGTVMFYDMNSRSKVALSIDVDPEDIMQAQAEPFSKLVIFEICSDPPYSEGRFTDLPEKS